MIRRQRSRHLQAWLLMALLLPACILISWLVIPNQVAVKLLNEPVMALLPDVLASANPKDYCVRIRTDNTKSAWQLEWINKTVLMVPSAVIYSISDSTKDITSGKLIGRIETKGSYLFKLEPINNPRKLKLVLYDFIHEQIIETINF